MEAEDQFKADVTNAPRDVIAMQKLDLRSQAMTREVMRDSVKSSEASAAAAAESARATKVAARWAALGAIMTALGVLADLILRACN